LTLDPGWKRNGIILKGSSFKARTVPEPLQLLPLDLVQLGPDVMAEELQLLRYCPVPDLLRLQTEHKGYINAIYSRTIPIQQLKTQLFSGLNL
jgi:hypothetical protein